MDFEKGFDAALQNKSYYSLKTTSLEGIPERFDTLIDRFGITIYVRNASNMYEELVKPKLEVYEHSRPIRVEYRFKTKQEPKSTSILSEDGLSATFGSIMIRIRYDVHYVEGVKDNDGVKDAEGEKDGVKDADGEKDGGEKDAEGEKDVEKKDAEGEKDGGEKDADGEKDGGEKDADGEKDGGEKDVGKKDAESVKEVNDEGVKEEVKREYIHLHMATWTTMKEFAESLQTYDFAEGNSFFFVGYEQDKNTDVPIYEDGRTLAEIHSPYRVYIFSTIPHYEEPLM